jgi:Flavodoxins
MRPRHLIVFFSLTGRTRRAALTLAERLGADVEEIAAPSASRARPRLLRLGGAALLGLSAAIAAPARDPADYDVTIVATPVWAGRVSTPVRAYLEARGARAPRLAFLATAAGGGPHAAFRDMERIAGLAPLAVCTLSGANGDVPETATALLRFSDSLDAAAPVHA